MYVSGDDSDIVPRKKAVQYSENSESELENSDLNTDEWKPRDKLLSVEPNLGFSGVHKIPAHNTCTCRSDSTHPLIH
ncbi:hypothetical protein HNY73_004171 [Argiope bruennichi]|uniref:Uncharacterized protein n=1 Tax=Argiope bruennichi TaxID=94029 RepID=A0A8T0FN27_ARGBR|nr:hypothetical protein HNY73_004171 [Argiope bruennichi]